jgi:DNA-binding NarL/FixJ family response regulator
MDVVATTNNGEHALDLARLLQPDVALIDWDMPHFGGALTARLMTRYAPDVTPVLLRGHEVREAPPSTRRAQDLGSGRGRRLPLGRRILGG